MRYYFNSVTRNQSEERSYSCVKQKRDVLLDVLLGEEQFDWMLCFKLEMGIVNWGGMGQHG